MFLSFTNLHVHNVHTPNGVSTIPMTLLWQRGKNHGNNNKKKSIRFNLKAERESTTLYQIYYSRVDHLLLWVQFYFICFPIILCTGLFQSLNISVCVLLQY